MSEESSSFVSQLFEKVSENKVLVTVGLTVGAAVLGAVAYSMSSGSSVNDTESKKKSKSKSKRSRRGSGSSTVITNAEDLEQDVQTDEEDVVVNGSGSTATDIDTVDDVEESVVQPVEPEDLDTPENVIETNDNQDTPESNTIVDIDENISNEPDNTDIIDTQAQESVVIQTQETFGETQETETPVEEIQTTVAETTQDTTEDIAPETQATETAVEEIQETVAETTQENVVPETPEIETTQDTTEDIAPETETVEEIQATIPETTQENVVETQEIETTQNIVDETQEIDTAQDTTEPETQVTDTQDNAPENVTETQETVDAIPEIEGTETAVEEIQETVAETTQENVVPETPEIETTQDTTEDIAPETVVETQETETTEDIAPENVVETQGTETTLDESQETEATQNTIVENAVSEPVIRDTEETQVSPETLDVEEPKEEILDETDDVQDVVTETVEELDNNTSTEATTEITETQDNVSAIKEEKELITPSPVTTRIMMGQIKKIDSSETLKIPKVETIHSVENVATPVTCYTFCHDNGFESSIVRIVARYCGIALKLKEDPEVQGILLVTEEGELSDVNSICRFIAHESVAFGENVYERALINGWIEFAEVNFLVPSEKYFLPVQKIQSSDYYQMKQAIENMVEKLKVLNEYLSKNTFLAGRFISIADIIIALSVAPLFSEVLGKNHIKHANHVIRWVKTVLEQPEVLCYTDAGVNFSLCKNSPVPNNPPRK
eukprot:TRINITY_DN402_c0_g1_i1.p1 TRINITY_DN402_c0_g1~~TRINITY_DN402_c0_g1_i1.p1  ORF type:complete len:733 (-),score=265.22 TRINITY_DN402_c0_g1_i1:23-2221(-)